MPSLRDVILVALHELKESIVSVRAIVVFVLFVLGSLALSEGCVRAAQQAEDQIRADLEEEWGEEGGEMMAEQLDTVEIRAGVLEDVFNGDRELAEKLAPLPYLGLFFPLMMMTFVPFMIVIFAGDSISNELATGSVRFSLFRTDRTSWALGKFLGQALLIIVALLLGAAATIAFGIVRIEGVEVGPWSSWMIEITLRMSALAFAWTGIAIAVSQVFRSRMAAWAIGFCLVISFGIIGSIFGNQPDGSALQMISKIFPTGYRFGLWTGDVVSVVALCVLGLVYFGLGHFIFRLRDV